MYHLLVLEHQVIEIPISESHNPLNSDFEICHSISKKEHELHQKCWKVGINFESRTQIENENENENEMSKILKKNYDKLRYKLKKSLLFNTSGAVHVLF
jgi:hypothetical protein